MPQNIQQNYIPALNRILELENPSIHSWLQLEFLNEQNPNKFNHGEEISQSAIVKKLLSERDVSGRIQRYAYEKWTGAHWILSLLAELNYPPNDPVLLPLREQALGWIFNDEVRVKGTPKINGLYRRHASQEGNLITYLIKLGLEDERIHRLTYFLLECQWPDGGWNCDKNKDAHTSSFIESILPLRGLISYQKKYPNSDVAIAIEKACEFFLCRNLFRKLSDHSVINPHFIELTFPHYHIYDILIALMVMDEAGKIDDLRCQEALNLLEQKYIPEQGWSIENTYEQHNPHKHRFHWLIGINKKSEK
ncbi:MAG: hypothetical protein ACYDH1_10520 [Anaerolineaceae bacterium]